MTVFFLIPLIIGAIGFVNYFFHSKQRNMLGYRSHFSLKNDRMWRLAQKTSGTSMMSASSFIICLNYLFIQMDFSSTNLTALLLSASIFCVLYTIVYTELILEKAYVKPEYNRIDR